MTNLIGDFAYSGENALDLYHLFVNELDSKIVDGYLNIGSFHLRILENDNKNTVNSDFQILKKTVIYVLQKDISNIYEVIIRYEKCVGKKPILKLYHFIEPKYDIFHFPLNNVIVKEQPILCFNRWMEIAVNGMPTLNQVAEFDRFLKSIKEPRNFKRKINFLRLSLNKSRQHSLLNSIISDENLKSEIVQNAYKHL